MKLYKREGTVLLQSDNEKEALLLACVESMVKMFTHKEVSVAKKTSLKGKKYKVTCEKCGRKFKKSGFLIHVSAHKKRDAKDKVLGQQAPLDQSFQAIDPGSLN